MDTFTVLTAQKAKAEGCASTEPSAGRQEALRESSGRIKPRTDKSKISNNPRAAHAHKPGLKIPFKGPISRLNIMTGTRGTFDTYEVGTIHRRNHDGVLLVRLRDHCADTGRGALQSTARAGRRGGGQSARAPGAGCRETGYGGTGRPGTQRRLHLGCRQKRYRVRGRRYLYLGHGIGRPTPSAFLRPWRPAPRSGSAPRESAFSGSAAPGASGYPRHGLPERPPA
jgi:hypothetical protein